MKKSTETILKFTKGTGIGNVLAKLPSENRLLKKAVPLPSLFDKNDSYRIKRDEAVFKVNRSDYMQWYIYANLPERAWSYAIESIKSSADPVIFDIGSNVGAFSIKTAVNARKHYPDLNLHAFDPNPVIGLCFLNNLSLNPHVKKHINFNQFALGEKEGKANFQFSEKNSGSGSVQNEGELTVPMKTLDGYCRENFIELIDFIKIDVEGFEPLVIRGGKQVLEKSRPEMYIEITPSLFRKNGASAEELFQFLFALDYEIFCEEEKLKPITTDNLFRFLENYQFNILVKKKKL